jgi:hypothetical protein
MITIGAGLKPVVKRRRERERNQITRGERITRPERAEVRAQPLLKADGVGSRYGVVLNPGGRGQGQVVLKQVSTRREGGVVTLPIVLGRIAVAADERLILVPIAAGRREIVARVLKTSGSLTDDVHRGARYDIDEVAGAELPALVHPPRHAGGRSPDRRLIIILVKRHSRGRLYHNAIRSLGRGWRDEGEQGERRPLQPHPRPPTVS